MLSGGMIMRSKRIKLIADLAKRDEDQLAQNFQAAKNFVAQEHERLIELQSYYASYSNMFANKTTHLHAQDIIQARNLLGRLADAQVAQKRQIDRAQEQLHLAKEQWQGAHLKRRSMEDLAERCVVEEQQERDKKEQKQSDEWSSMSRVDRS